MCRKAKQRTLTYSWIDSECLEHTKATHQQNSIMRLQESILCILEEAQDTDTLVNNILKLIMVDSNQEINALGRHFCESLGEPRIEQ